MELDLKPNQKKIADLLALAAKFRGEYLNEFSILEYSIEEIIVKYFTNNHPKKEKELLHLLIGAVNSNFNTKKFLVAFIATQFPEFHRKNKTFDDKLTKAVTFRNIIAHQKLSLTPKDWSNFDYINVEFFITTSDKKKIVTVPKIINQEEVDAQILNVHKAQYMCMALHNLVIFDK